MSTFIQAAGNKQQATFPPIGRNTQYMGSKFLQKLWKEIHQTMSSVDYAQRQGLASRVIRFIDIPTATVMACLFNK